MVDELDKCNSSIDSIASLERNHDFPLIRAEELARVGDTLAFLKFLALLSLGAEFGLFSMFFFVHFCLAIANPTLRRGSGMCICVFLEERFFFLDFCSEKSNLQDCLADFFLESFGVMI